MGKLYQKLSKLLCFLLILGASSPAFSQQQQLPIDTTDKFVISGLETDDDGTFFTVSLVSGDNPRKYCAYNLVITLPLGLTFATDEGAPMIYWAKKQGFYPSSKREDFYHSFAAQLSEKTDRIANIICYSPTATDFSYTEGTLLYAYINISPWAKADTNEIIMNNLCLTTKENSQSYIPVGGVNTGELEISGENREVEINITPSNQWGTCILPFDYTPGTDFKAFNVKSVSAEEVQLSAVDEMEAYKPYILYAEGGYSATLNGTAIGSDFPDEAIVNVGGLCGSIVPGTAENGYILQNQGDGTKFYQIGSTPFAIKAGKCYLAPVSGGSYMLRIRMNETAIEDVQIDHESTDIYYNMSGQRVSNPESGIFIHNGKKQLKTK